MVLHHFVMEHREVEGKAELDGVAGWKRYVVGFLVGIERLLLDFLKKGALCIFSDVAVVVADHLDEEGLGLTVAALLDDLVVDHVNNTLAVSGELGLDVLFVAGKIFRELGILGVLLNSSNCAARRSLAANQVLEGH